VRFVQHLDEGAAVDDLDAVEHRAGRSVPFSDHENIAGAEFVDGLLELGPVFDRFAAGLLAEDGVDAFGTKRAKLPIQVLVRQAFRNGCSLRNFATGPSTQSR
jgi:hypothetical protein